MDQRTLTRSLIKFFNDNDRTPPQRLASMLLFAVTDGYYNSHVCNQDNEKVLNHFAEMAQRL